MARHLKGLIDRLQAARTVSLPTHEYRGLCEAILEREGRAVRQFRVHDKDTFPGRDIWNTYVSDFDAWEFPWWEAKVVLHHASTYDRTAIEAWAAHMELPETYPQINVMVPLVDPGPRPTGDLTFLISRSEDTGNFGVWYSFTRGDLETNCQWARYLIEPWKAAHRVRLSEIERDGILGFEVEADEQGIRVASRKRTPPPSAPQSLSIDSNEPLQVILSRFLAGIDALPCSPVEMKFLMRMAPDRYPEVIQSLSGLSRTWGYSFNSRYRDGLDPFERPAIIPEGAPLRYPVVAYEYHDDYTLDLQIDVVHTAKQSFLEFQTTGDWGWIEKILDDMNVKIEFWDGPFAERWGE